MSLNSAMAIGITGMRAAQAGLRTTSDNIANVNTAGYVRKVVDQSPNVLSGAGAGVTIDGIRRTTDIFLQRAMLDAQSQVGQSGAVAEFLGRAQALFGDPSGGSSFFNLLDPISAAFTTASQSPTSGLRLDEARGHIKRFFDDAAEIGTQLRALGTQANTRISSVIDRANGLLDDINALNSEISRAVLTGGDPSGAENVQSGLVDELSGLLKVQVSRGTNGGVKLAVADGTLLTGENRGRLEFASENGAPGIVRLKFDFGQPVTLGEGLGGGELKGLIELRDRLLPELGEQLSEFTTRAADALNRAHNAASTSPAPTFLTGRPVLAPLSDAIEGFTGRSVVAITNADGFVQRRVDIDFSTRTMSVDGAAATPWTPGGFEAALNTALSPMAAASFDTAAGGVLSIAATGAGRISVADDPALPSDRAGRGFSHYFGLNDVVASARPAFYDNGLTLSDPHGFAPGGEIKLRFNDGTGVRFADATVTIPAGGTLGDLVNALNSPTSVGKVGVFALENGAIRFRSTVTPSVAMSVLQDTSAHSFGGASLGAVHGFGGQRALRAESFAIRPEIAGNSSRLSLAKFNFNAAVGQNGLSRGDGRGAFGLADAFGTEISFSAAGETAAIRTSVANYAAQLGGAIGRKADLADQRVTGAGIVLDAAAARRSSVEGVNLDEEVIQLTVYQQAFSASARLITAAKEMYDVLLAMT
jgi:flagellar hook-associated protein 1 FlgK